MTKKPFLILFVLLFSFSSFAQTASKQLVGTVVRVHDGDTLTIRDASGNQFQIRLAGIDAPELRQEYGRGALYNLSGFVFGKNVTVTYKKIDKYGRIVGKVMLNGRDVCLKQIEDGCAWHYKEYENEQTESDRKLYTDAEKASRQSEKGLWIASALAPWEWRAAKSANGSESPTPQPAQSRDIVNSNPSSPVDSSPASSGSSNRTVQVKGYTRKDGTYVPPYVRSAPKRKN